MQIVLLALIFLCFAWTACVVTFFALTLIKVSEQHGIDLPIFGDRKKRMEEAKEAEERNDRYDNLLEQLSYGITVEGR